MNRLFILTLSAAILLSGCKAGNNNASDGQETPEPVAVEAEVTEPEETEAGETATDTTATAEMIQETKYTIETSMGPLTIKLYDETPLHKANFEKLAKSHFFDGILFHRVINGFMIQVGDPLTKDSTQVSRWGTGGPGYTIPAEIVPGLTHKKGALAAARRGDSVNPAKESSGSQFYIVQDENGCRHLDGEYTIFGEVVSGFETIDKIASTPTDFRDKPLRDIEILTVREEK